MKRQIILILLFIIALFSCKKGDCPFDNAVRSEILVGDTLIMQCGINECEEKSNEGKLRVGYYGTGFINRLNKPLHKPFQIIQLDKTHSNEIIEILSKKNSREYSMVSSCMPMYRHAIVFYDINNKSIGHIDICFTCGQTHCLPENECILDIEDIRDFDGLFSFFKKNNVYIKEY